MDLSATCNVVDLAQYQDPSALDWQGFVDSGVKAVIIQLSHGTSYEPYAREHIAKANQYGLIVHGYHYYEGTSGEVDFSISNANTVGLSKNSYMFLDFEDTTIQGDWQSQSFDFFNAWKSAGWNAGLYTGNSLYQSKFNNDVLVANGIYRWIAQYGSNSGSLELNWEPINYDIWQYSSVGGIGYYNSNLDKSYDRTGKLITKATTPPPVVTTDQHEPPAPIGGAYVGTGVDTTGLNGGKGIGYSTNGHDFYMALSPVGFVFRQVDADRMWKLIQPKIGTIQGSKGDKGATGSQGPIGETGPQGPAGKNGVGASVDLTPYAKKTEVIPSNLVSLEINAGATFDTPFIDFHTKTGVNDYDARIIVAGGKSGAVGQANMNIVANGGVIINGKKVATVDQINPWNSITDKGHDLNTVITDGRYWCKATMGNAPVATWGYLYVNSADPARVQQDFVSDSTAEKYIRMKFGDSWTAWIQETTNQLGQLVQTIKGTAATNFELDGTANAYVYQLAPSLKLVAINAGVNPKSGVSIPEWSVTTLINWASAMPAYSSTINDAVYILGNTSIVAGNFQTNSFGVVNGSVKIDAGSGHTKINVAYLSKS